jgi:hypothetical protein
LVSYKLVVVAMRSVCGPAVFTTAVGVVAEVVGVGLVHPAKQVARNSSTKTAAIKVTCTFFVIIKPDYR